MVNIDAFQLLIQNAIHTLIMSDTDGEELDHSITGIMGTFSIGKRVAKRYRSIGIKGAFVCILRYYVT